MADSLKLLIRSRVGRLLALLILSLALSIVLRFAAERLVARLVRPPAPPQSAPRSQAPRTMVQQASAPGQRVPSPVTAYAVPAQLPWSTAHVFLALAFLSAAFVLGILLMVGFLTIVDLNERAENIILLLSTLALQGVMLLSVWFFALRSPDSRWDRLGFRRIKPISTTIIAMFGIVSAYAAVLAYTELVEWLGIEILIPGPVPAEWAGDGVAIAIFAISAVCIAPFVEEIFFRGFIYQGLRRTMAVLPAALLTSIFFGIAHIDPSIIIPVAVVGMILLGIYRWTNNLWSSIITHSGYNAVMVVGLAVETWGV